mgnify:FL=1
MRSSAVKPVYYPWTASDQPAAFASAAVIDSKVALATLDPAQATTEGAGGSVLGERTYTVVHLIRPACAVTSASASLSDLTRDTLVGCGWAGVSFRWYYVVGGLLVGH